MRLHTVEIGYFEDYEDDEVLEVAIAGVDATGARRSFSFQRATCEPDEQDVQGGMDSYCVSNERGETLYGCLRLVRRDGSHLTLEFTADDAAILELTGPVEADLGTADGAEFGAKLRDVLDWGAEDRRPELHL
ncbi:Imm10 family immunity protein [Lentzea sp. CA-135723]|uniref:Imm10 family immunity protein n=1 Tax=Lentzea sp. CA-135723 TaxID=3239950 RepID=UPI003D8F27FC